MKHGRIKHSKKTLTFFRQEAGFEEPFHVIMDGTFVYAALVQRAMIAPQAQKVFGPRVRLRVTRCVVDELKRLGGSFAGAARTASSFGIHPCAHTDAEWGVPAAKCLRQLVAGGNRDKLIVASQDPSLQDVAREVRSPGGCGARVLPARIRRRQS